jgi:RHS repeat-associated protein
MVWLVVSLPIVHAENLNLVTDANGNLVTGDGLFREYNSLNQLVNVRNGSNSSAPLLQRFTYHPTEERIDIKRTYNSTGTIVETVYYWTRTFVEIVNLSGDYNFTYVYHDGQLIAQELQGTKTFVHGNHEGSSSVVTNATGQVVERTEYSPFGEVVSGGTKTRFGYENKEADSLVGDTDFGFRKYKSEWGLFTQPDTLIQNVYDPQALNRYMFERGNSYKNNDPDGHAIPAILLALFFLGVGFLAGYQISQKVNELEEQQGDLTVSDASLVTFEGLTVASTGSISASGGIVVKAKSFLAKQAVRLGVHLNLDERITKAHYKNVFKHVSANRNINTQSSTSLQNSITNTLKSSLSSGDTVKWYYNEKTDKYQYWIGKGKPPNDDYKLIDKKGTPEDE